MINSKLFGSLQMMQQALNLRMEKQGVIQANIANMETPGYKARELPFEEALSKAVDRQGQVAVSRTDSRHLGGLDVQPASFVEVEDREVDLDEEMLKLSKNQLMYQIATTLVGKKLSGLKSAIDEGGQ